MLEHINRQIEKSMRAGVVRGGGGNPPSAAPVPTPPSAPYSESRLTQVIEESLLGPRPPAPAPPLEGLACPRGRLTPKDLCSPPMAASRPPSTNSKAGSLHTPSPIPNLHTPSPIPLPEMDERHQRHQQQQQEIAAQAFLQHQASLISGHPHQVPPGHNYPQPPTSSLILQHPPTHLQHQPANLQHPAAHPGPPPPTARRPGDETRRWQDEISHGFERLVALASKVDKRKRSEGDQGDQHLHKEVDSQPPSQAPPSVPLCNPSSTPYIPCPVNSSSLHFKKKYFAQQYQAQHHSRSQDQASGQVHTSQDQQHSQN